MAVVAMEIVGQTKRDGRGPGLISPLRNADKASTGSPIGYNLIRTFNFKIYF